jgi:hypothetical protein
VLEGVLECHPDFGGFQRKVQSSTFEDTLTGGEDQQHRGTLSVRLPLARLVGGAAANWSPFL